MEEDKLIEIIEEEPAKSSPQPWGLRYGNIIIGAAIVISMATVFTLGVSTNSGLGHLRFMSMDLDARGGFRA